MSEEKHIESWPDLAAGLYDKLTGRGASITYDFQNLTVEVPTKVGSAEKTAWNLKGKLTISTSEPSKN